MAARNAHILHNHAKCTETSFLPYVITIAEYFIALGRNGANHWADLVKKTRLRNVGDHLHHNLIDIYHYFQQILNENILWAENCVLNKNISYNVDTDFLKIY